MFGKEEMKLTFIPGHNCLHRKSKRSKIAEYKFSAQKSTAFLYTNN